MATRIASPDQQRLPLHHYQGVMEMTAWGWVEATQILRIRVGGSAHPTARLHKYQHLRVRKSAARLAHKTGISGPVRPVCSKLIVHHFGICQRQQRNASFLGIEFRKLLQEMSGPPNSSGLRDNYSRGNVADFLRAKIREGSLLSVVSAYFTIYAYDALKTSLDRIDHLDFLFGEPSFLGRLDPNRTQAKSVIINADGLELTNKLQQKRVARECAEWIQSKVDIKTIKQSNLLHGKMYRVANAGVEDAILGSSNFTVRGLGLGNGDSNIELNLEVDSNRDRRDLKIWFNELWNDPALVEDVKAEVLQYLCQLYQNHAPEFVYYKTLF